MLVCGIANEHSIAYGCAKAFRELGADLAITYLNEKAQAVRRAAGTRSSRRRIFLPLDVAQPGELEAVFAAIDKQWGRLDVLVHSIAWAPKDDLQGGLLTARPRASPRRWTSPAIPSSAWRGWRRR